MPRLIPQLDHSLRRALPLVVLLLVVLLLVGAGPTAVGGQLRTYEGDVRPILKTHCFACHGGDEVNGDVNFATIVTPDDVEAAFEIWEKALAQLAARTMPPEGHPQPTAPERATIDAWYRQFVNNIEPQPAVFRPRRLSVTEYRNTLRSVFGFDLEVAIVEAEQTLAERSLVVKLLPTDPPGRSGFKNDTHENPLSTVAWDQYSYLVDVALEQFFSAARRTELEAFTGPLAGHEPTAEQAERLLRTFVPRAWRRAVAEEELAKIIARVGDQRGSELVAAVKFELKAALMSPAFLYRGLLVSGQRGGRQPVDAFELAERLSYFLWADMPDERLRALAADGSLVQPAVYHAEIDRLLGSPQARSLAEVFATEWLTLNEIDHVSDNPPVMVALKSQPIDFLHYLFTAERPLLELIDSQTAFISPHTARMYGRDAGQLKRYVKQRGIEVEIVPNQKIRLEHATERGGILTMPGILAMNKGPILRGTWMLERILGEPLPDPPANVGQVPPNPRGENLTFRQRFEQHRSNPSCALCHDKIDPLGFALQRFDNQGNHLRGENDKPGGKNKKGQRQADPPSRIDTSGRLPSGESFDDFAGLKRLLVTTQRETVIRNIVERTMSYALCRKLKIHDQPTIKSMVKDLDETDGTWRDLFHAVADSVPFRETILVK